MRDNKEDSKIAPSEIISTVIIAACLISGIIILLVTLIIGIFPIFSIDIW